MITDSRLKKLGDKDLIQTAFKETKSPYTPDQAFAAIVAESRTPTTITMREGNTLFLINYDPKDKTTGVFRPLNADTATNYVRNIKTFLHAASLAGFRTLYVEFSDPAVLTLFKTIDRNKPLSGMSYTVKKVDSKTYMATVKLPGKQQGSK
jgi:hypothetical protein